MNQKQFIQSRGATCRNWTWSWSFINHGEQFVIFGVRDTEWEKEREVILQGYELFTFKMGVWFSVWFFANWLHDYY